MEEDENKTYMTKSKRKDLGLSCMLNAEVGALLAVIRRPPESSYHHPDDACDASILQSLKSLRALLFRPQQEWRTIDPSVYMSPFLDVIQSDDIPASATAAALQSVLKILRLGIFDEKTQGGREAINAAVNAITGCRLEKTDPVTEDAVMMRILQALTAVMRHCASILLTDHSTCTLVNTCFQVDRRQRLSGQLFCCCYFQNPSSACAGSSTDGQPSGSAPAVREVHNARAHPGHILPTPRHRGEGLGELGVGHGGQRSGIRLRHRLGRGHLPLPLLPTQRGGRDGRGRRDLPDDRREHPGLRPVPHQLRDRAERGQHRQASKAPANDPG